MRSFLLDLFGPPSVRPEPPALLAPDASHTPHAPDIAARYTHPQANRRALLADTLVEYALRRGRRRTIGFAVGAEGLTVSAPHWTAQTDIDMALREKARWIVTSLMQARERAAELAAARIDWRSGAVVPYLGAPLMLVADPRGTAARGGAALVTLDPASGVFPDSGQPQTLHLLLPPDATPAQWRDATAAWLKRQARRLFTARLDHYAPQLSVRWQRLSLSSARTRWGSASSTGWIRLNWRLIHLPLPVINYVVVHELAHLREMNHSPRFWALVSAVLPDYAAHRMTLRDAVLPGF
ncbi:MAG: M48 family metallopeptidase [Burkholderiaceae bacterium]|jgi:predicted metal-dependent hydrolase|nr:M48 family metallopeptidase [Burkholderiaceae bacterium]